MKLRAITESIKFWPLHKNKRVFSFYKGTPDQPGKDISLLNGAVRFRCPEDGSWTVAVPVGMNRKIGILDA